MKTETEIISNGKDKIKMVEATYKITLEGLDYADVANIAICLRAKAAEYSNHAIKSERIGGGVFASAANVASSSLINLARAFDVQKLIEANVLKIGESFHQIIS